MSLLITNAYPLLMIEDAKPIEINEGTIFIQKLLMQA